MVFQFHLFLLIKFIYLTIDYFYTYDFLELFEWVMLYHQYSIKNLKFLVSYLYSNKFYIKVNHDLAQAINLYSKRNFSPNSYFSRN